MKSTLARGLVPKNLAASPNPPRAQDPLHHSSKPRRKKHRVHTTFKQNLDSLEKLYSKNEHLSRIINKHFNYEKQPDYFRPAELNLDQNSDISGLKKARELLDRIKQSNAEAIAAANKDLKETPREIDALNGLITSRNPKNLPINKWIIIETPRNQLQKLKASGSLQFSDLYRNETSGDSDSSRFALLKPIKTKQSIPPIKTYSQGSQDSILSSFRQKEITARANDCSVNYISRMGLGPKRGALEAYLDFSDQNAKTMEEESNPLVPLPLPKLVFQNGVMLSPRNSQNKPILPLNEAYGGRSSPQSDNIRQESRNLAPISTRTQRKDSAIDFKKKKQFLYDPVRSVKVFKFIK